MSLKKVNLNKEIIALFSGQSSTVTIPKLYIQLTGRMSLAAVLNQCVYWSNKSKLKDGWFYKTYEDWGEEIDMSQSTLRRSFNKLESEGWIKTKVKKVAGLNIKHLYADIDKIIESISNKLGTDSPNRSSCQDGSEIEQKNCIKVVPTGHVDRSEPVKMTGSSITDDYLQIKPHPQTPNTGVGETDFFKTFWEKYPIKKSKKKCAILWCEKNLDSVFQEIIDKVCSQKIHDSKWLRGYAPHPFNYLNDERWQDEIEMTTEAKQKLENEKLALEIQKRREQQDYASKQRAEHEMRKRIEISDSKKIMNDLYQPTH